MGRFGRKFRRHSLDRLPRYAIPVLHHGQELLANGFIEPGSVHHVEIQHDDDCPKLAGGECCCDVNVVSGPAIDEKYTP